MMTKTMMMTMIMVTMTIIDVDDQTYLVSLPGAGRTPKPWLTRVVHKVVWLN